MNLVGGGKGLAPGFLAPEEYSDYLEWKPVSFTSDFSEPPYIQPDNQQVELRACDLEDVKDFSDPFFFADYEKRICIDDISQIKLNGNLYSTTPSRTYGM